jgi:hypothetical protein
LCAVEGLTKLVGEKVVIHHRLIGHAKRHLNDGSGPASASSSSGVGKDERYVSALCRDNPAAPSSLHAKVVTFVRVQATHSHHGDPADLSNEVGDLFGTAALMNTHSVDVASGRIA